MTPMIVPHYIKVSRGEAHRFGTHHKGSVPLRAPARLVFLSMLLFNMKYRSCHVVVCGCGFVFSFTVFKEEYIATSHFLFRE